MQTTATTVTRDTIPKRTSQTADPADYNCDGSVGYVDADGGGTPACEDCDDSNPDAYPGARWFLDRDGDGYGVQVAEQCLPPEGFVNNKDDCDDKNPMFIQRRSGTKTKMETDSETGTHRFSNATNPICTCLSLTTATTAMQPSIH